ncbi:MAG: outer membrane protein transport protein [Dysgonamonadaceae bacterium]|nr:outer membrane protein transport protein [Dysgonamonadaceae bacterium]
MKERGYIETYDFSLGTNFSDKFYLGATFSLTNILYHLDSFYGEKLGEGGTIGLDNYFETQGAGYQFNAGVIWRPVDALRLGVAYHSPVWYSLTDYYQGTAKADHAGGNTGQEGISTPNDALTDYRFNTPYYWVFSAAGVIGTKAVVSLDYEIKDYSGMNLMDKYGKEKEFENHYIQQDFKTASTVRAGLEYRFTPQFSGRLGYSWVENPYKTEFKDNPSAGEYLNVNEKYRYKDLIVGTVPHYTIESNVNYLTAGIGYRFTPRFYVDATLVYRSQTDDLYYFPSYEFINNNGEHRQLVKSIPAKLTNNTYKGLVTVGYKF